MFFSSQEDERIEYCEDATVTRVDLLFAPLVLHNGPFLFDVMLLEYSLDPLKGWFGVEGTGA